MDDEEYYAKLKTKAAQDRMNRCHEFYNYKTDPSITPPTKSDRNAGKSISLAGRASGEARREIAGRRQPTENSNNGKPNGRDACEIRCPA